MQEEHAMTPIKHLYSCRPVLTTLDEGTPVDMVAVARKQCASDLGLAVYTYLKTHSPSVVRVTHEERQTGEVLFITDNAWIAPEPQSKARDFSC